MMNEWNIHEAIKILFNVLFEQGMQRSIHE